MIEAAVQLKLRNRTEFVMMINSIQINTRMKFVNQLILAWMIVVFASCSKYQSENVNSIVLESGGYIYRQKN